VHKLSVVSYSVAGEEEIQIPLRSLPSTFSLAAYRLSNFSVAGESTPATDLFQQGMPGRGLKLIAICQASLARSEAFGLFTRN